MSVNHLHKKKTKNKVFNIKPNNEKLLLDSTQKYIINPRAKDSIAVPVINGHGLGSTKWNGCRSCNANLLFLSITLIY